MVFEHDYTKNPELTNTQLEMLQFSSPHQQITEDFDATVVKVHDGDTITLRAGFRDFDFPLRFLDVDAPEMNVGGAEARDWLKSRILNAQVKIMIDPDNRVGKYGRLLGRLVHNGMIIADEMLHLGLVKPFGAQQEGELPSLIQMFSLKQWLSI